MLDKLRWVLAHAAAGFLAGGAGSADNVQADGSGRSRFFDMSQENAAQVSLTDHAAEISVIEFAAQSVSQVLGGGFELCSITVYRLL